MKRYRYVHRGDLSAVGSQTLRQSLHRAQTPFDDEQARDLLASLLTRVKGEHIFRIGSRPLHSKLFAGDSISATDGQSGTARTVEDSDVIKKGVITAVDEVGGTVGNVLPLPRPY